MVRIEGLDDRDWRVLRGLRLAALSEAPDAFWATWEEEAAFGPEEWRGFVRGVQWFIAVRDGTPVGMVGCLRRSECPDEPELISTWVEPAERGSGTADALLDAVIGWAVDQGIDAISLWITEGNDGARRFYQRHRFRVTGERAALPLERGGVVERMDRRGLSRFRRAHDHHTDQHQGAADELRCGGDLAEQQPGQQERREHLGEADERGHA